MKYMTKISKFNKGIKNERRKKLSGLKFQNLLIMNG